MALLSKNGKPLKAIGFRKAIDLMRQRPETRLILTKSETGNVYYLAPGGYVEPDTAHRIINHPQVTASEDCLWPGMSQTWQRGRGGGGRI